MQSYTSQDIKEFISKPLFDERIILNKDQNCPKISIVTPSYNQGKFLEKTILSVLNQNYPNLEYIIMDGGSRDGSIGIIKEYEKYFTYWISEKDEGQADAINKGFQKSTGEILAWLNSDDLYLPETLFKIANIFIRDKKINFIYGHSILINEKDDIIRAIYTVPQTYYSYIHDGGNIFQGSVFWRRKLFYKYGMLDKKLQYVMEYYLFDKFFKNERGCFLNDILAAYRLHQEAKFYKVPHEVRAVERNNLRKIKSNVILKIYYRFRRILYYLIYGNLIKTLKEKVKGSL